VLDFEGPIHRAITGAAFHDQRVDPPGEGGLINLKTARALGLTVPLPLLALAERGYRMRFPMRRRDFVSLLGPATPPGDVRWQD